MKSAGIEYEQNSQQQNSQRSPVIFLHGIGGSAASFSAQLASLHQYHCIAWNMPGYGASDKDPWPPTFETITNKLNEFIASLGLNNGSNNGLNKVHLVGQSIGGMVAIEYALKHSEQVASLSLIATTSKFGGADESFKTQFLKARLAPLDAGQTMQAMAKKAAPLLVGPATDEKVIDEIESILAGVSESTWRGILECLVTFDRKNDLATIDLPCCLIAGSHDNNAPARTMKKMSDAINNSEFHLIDGAGHMVNQEAADLTNNIINTFIGKHPL